MSRAIIDQQDDSNTDAEELTHRRKGGGGAVSCHGAAAQAMSWHGAQWFMYSDEWHLCHLCHLCRLCHPDTEGGVIGGAAARVVTWVSS